MKKKCISSVLHRQLGVEDGLPLQTSQRVAKSVKVKMHTMLKSKKGVLYRCSICSGCVAALSSSDALNEKGPGIQQTEESTEATEQPSHSSDNLQDPDRVFTFTAASVEDDVKRMPKEIRALLAFEIAKAERQEIIHKAHDLTTKTGVDNLAHLSSEQFLQDVNRVLTQFLFGLYGAKFGDYKRNSDAYRIAHVTESCMGLTTPIATLPHHFRETILLYKMTRSRAAISLFGSTSLCGSYQTTKKWLAELSSETPERVSKSDIVAVFDNNQVLQRRWGIAVGNKACASIVTMTMFIKHQAESTLQTQENLKPSHCLWSGLSVELPSLLNSEKSSHLTNTKFKKHFHPWLTGILEKVAAEQTVLNGISFDGIDATVGTSTMSRDSKDCPQCHIQVKKRARKCPNCPHSREEDLKNLASKARLKKSNFMVAFYEGFCMDNEMTVSFKEPPLFVTPDERAEFERIDRRTVIEIEAMINDAIASIIDPDLHGILSEEFVEMFHRGKKPLKRSYIDFYLYVKSCSELSTDEPESD
ncbi:hypothetical protein CAPTEDRAFT_216042 [Capitella teleta]|uniref:Uncharacterized protein n=1 Tax=Capitella teleta TaxID=283909 RepID=R7TSC5_CAPTE|nr:hypothetical protein CAPTEDRAFT_216042 [Capitella teleta]|eukprot:ELT96507.1 hypothetical protein CAPTEDRAFT_216042 [Capitella teleta]